MLVESHAYRPLLVLMDILRHLARIGNGQRLVLRSRPEHPYDRKPDPQPDDWQRSMLMDAALIRRT